MTEPMEHQCKPMAWWAKIWYWIVIYSDSLLDDGEFLYCPRCGKCLGTCD